MPNWSLKESSLVLARIAQRDEAISGSLLFKSEIVSSPPDPPEGVGHPAESRNYDSGDFPRPVKRHTVKAHTIALTAVIGQAATTVAQPVSPTSGYAPVNGLELYYEVHGAGDAGSVPLVLLHGGGSTIEASFGNVLQMLARNRQVIAFEQQGHGHTSDILDRPFTFEQSADDAAALMQYLKIERADFFGYSNGGSIALQIAIRHASLVRKLVVASAMYKRDGVYPELWESMQHATLESMPKELRDAYVAASPHPERLQSFHDKSVKRMLEFQDWPSEAISSIRAPTLIIIGDGDIIRPEHAVEMYRLLPQAQLAVLPGTDHMTLMRRSEWQVSMIEAFLGARKSSAK